MVVIGSRGAPSHGWVEVLAASVKGPLNKTEIRGSASTLLTLLNSLLDKATALYE
ncbi:hypothetical protein GCM10023186_01560 [Hymenobacter koreensis]|uniref:Uncharacterized protein n=1 Tax=Hymenobacter koreensis TaxID=1084523 RepID=A0ABP8ITK0_9BACT